MAIFRIVEGPPGQGKSLSTALMTKRLLQRNLRWYVRQLKEYEKNLDSWERSRSLRITDDERTAFEGIYPRPELPKRRMVASNIRFSEEFEAKWPVGEWLMYWTRLEELHDLRHADLIWDEIATELDARNWPNLAPETMRMLSQYRKRGLDIYANTQDFSMVDVRARLMITSVQTLTKLIGSPDPSATKPKVGKVWGVILIRGVENWKETQADKKKYSFFNWSLMLIEQELVDMYDTTQDIKHGGYPPMRHIERECELGDLCTDRGRHKVIHT